MKVIDVLAIILLVIGGLIWGIVGVSNFNLVTWLFVTQPVVQHSIYILIGLAAVWRIVQCKGISDRWCKKI